MADYDRRLQHLEELAASTSADDRMKEFGELCRKRTAELLASNEVLAYRGREVSDEEWAAEWAPIQAAIEAAQGKR